jgi:hypothetical protein
MLKHLKEYHEFEYSSDLNEGFVGDVKDLWNSFKKLLGRMLTKTFSSGGTTHVIFTTSARSCWSC